MLAAQAVRCSTLPLTAFVTTFGRATVTKVVPKQPGWLTTRLQTYASESRHAVRRQVQQTKSLKESIMAPAGDTGACFQNKKKCCFIFYLWFDKKQKQNP